MAKFTVFFKDKAIDSVFFDSGVIHIGRDESNDLALSSLAIAPAHAAVIIRDGSCIIKQLNDNFPLVVNNQKRAECQLQNNDRIILGKHSILFNSGESVLEAEALKTDPDVDSLNNEIETQSVEASLQVIDGKHIGRILPMKKAMTRLGRNGGGVVVITRRKEGYFISALENDLAMTVNNEPIGDKTVKLNSNDIIVIDNTSMQFFQARSVAMS